MSDYSADNKDVNLNFQAQRSTRSAMSSEPSVGTAITTQRTTLSLSDKDILRGTSSSVLLGRVASPMRNSVGTAAEYEESFVVVELDYFLSHSWHASWLLC